MPFGGWLKPVLPVNRAAFERYHRLQLRVLWLCPLVALVLVALVIGIVNLANLSGTLINKVMAPASIALLIAGGAVIGYAEIRKILLFRQDLRDQSTAAAKPPNHPDDYTDPHKATALD